jgi:hypothetical protein
MAPGLLAVEWPRARRRPADVADRAELKTKRLNRSEPRPTSVSMTLPCARLSGGLEQQTVMLTTFLVIVACVSAGMIMHHTEHGRRRW